jgi:hypothetical protein
MNIEFYLCDSLEKVFPSKRARPMDSRKFTLLKGEELNFQLVYKIDEADKYLRARYYEVEIISKLDGIKMYDVDLIPSQYLATTNRDRFYLDTDPGLYPDLLSPFEGSIKPMDQQYRALWFNLDKESSCKEGMFDVEIKLKEYILSDTTGERVYHSDMNHSIFLSVEILDKSIKKLDLLHTEWMHTDSIANYYGVDVFSDKYWEYVTKFIRFASKQSRINTLLTPIFTPPLDTDIGGERLTVQLVKIYKDQYGYDFDFGNLERWCAICKEEGIEYLEMAHLFTQWGAKKTPKIEVEENGEIIKKFGWHVEATDESYREFLESFIPELISNLDSFGYDKKHLFFHISDEPNEEHLENYLAAKNMVSDLLEGCNLIDALSSYEFYRRGVVDIPVPSNSAIEPFVGHCDFQWVYYCIAQGNLVPNRFFAMPSYRNRIMGTLMYLYNVRGFLHWGFNYYYDENSRNAINPFISSDGNRGFPAGDPYLVYPGENGEVLTSIRNQVQLEAFDDYMILKMVEDKIGRERTEAIIMESNSTKMSFTDYPHSSDYLISLRAKLIDVLKDSPSNS